MNESITWTSQKAAVQHSRGRLSVVVLHAHSQVSLFPMTWNGYPAAAAIGIALRYCTTYYYFHHILSYHVPCQKSKAIGRTSSGGPLYFIPYLLTHTISQVPSLWINNNNKHSLPFVSFSFTILPTMIIIIIIATRLFWLLLSFFCFCFFNLPARRRTAKTPN